MSDARIRIVLPVRDAEAHLDVCLRSVARQTETRFECVVVDDGSRDASPAIAEHFAQRDPRFQLLRGERRGLVDALHSGLAGARTHFLARMDADDWMHRDRLATQLAALEADDQLAAVGSQVRIFPRDALRDGRRAYERWLNAVAGPQSLRREAFVECPIAHPTLFARREAFDAHSYRDVDWPEDYDLLLRWLGAGFALAVVPRRLLAWRDHSDRLSRTSERYALARFTACKAYFLRHGFLAGKADYILWGYGSTGRALRRELAALGIAPSHIVDVHPRRLGQRIHGAPVVPPEALQSLERPRIVASVAGAGPRREIRETLDAMGFREGTDYLCAA